MRHLVRKLIAVVFTSVVLGGAPLVAQTSASQTITVHVGDLTSTKVLNATQERSGHQVVFEFDAAYTTNQLNKILVLDVKGDVKSMDVAFGESKQQVSDGHAIVDYDVSKVTKRAHVKLVVTYESEEAASAAHFYDLHMQLK